MALVGDAAMLADASATPQLAEVQFWRRNRFPLSHPLSPCAPSLAASSKRDISTGEGKVATVAVVSAAEAAKIRRSPLGGSAVAAMVPGADSAVGWDSSADTVAVPAATPAVAEAATFAKAPMACSAQLMV